MRPFSDTGHIPDPVTTAPAVSGGYPSDIELEWLANVMVVQHIDSVGWQTLLEYRVEGPLAGRWAPPGGHYEPGDESLAETARRELYEETGIEAQASELQPHGRGVALMLGRVTMSRLFLHERPPNQPDLLAPQDDEPHILAWVTPRVARSLPLAPGLMEIIDRTFPRDNGPLVVGIGLIAVDNMVEAGQPTDPL